ncbi:MAG: DUF4013 domain-containing protein [Pirellulaceae bacterium]
MSSDPFSTTPAAKLPPEGDAPKPQYFAALNYVFEHPDWAMSLLMGSVCMIIPILNSLIVLGYRYEIVEMKVRFPDQLYPKFDFNRFSQYLTRGLWPFLIDFIVQFIINIPLQISVWICIGLVAAAGESESRVLVVVAGIGIPLLILMVILFMIALMVLLVPITLRAGLCQDFGMTFNFPWIKDFLRKVGLQALLFNLFLIPVGFVLGMAGYLACCFGVLWVAFFLMGPVMAHYHGQLYRMYLAKGGEPIPLKPLQMLPAQTWPAPVPVPPKPPM